MTGFDASEITLPEIWASHARRQPRALALVCDGESMTWGAFDAAMNRLANALFARGIAKGDRVAVLVSSSIDAIVCMFGTVKSGAVMVPVSCMLTAEQVRTVLEDSGSRGLLCSADMRHLADPWIDELPELMPGAIVGTDFGGGPWVSLVDFCAVASEGEPPVRLAARDTFSIMYSSGTTGSPKGVVHSHSARTYFAISNGFEMRYDGSAVGLVTTALYTAGTWLVVVPTLLVGGTLHIHKRYDGRRFVEDLAGAGISHCFAVPSQLRGLLTDGLLEGLDLSDLRVLLSAGSPLRPDEKVRLIELVGDCFYELYGFTEGGSTLLQPADQLAKPLTVGRPLMGQEVAIIGEAGERCEPDMPGEIATRGPGLLSEYWQRPEATREAIWRDDEGRTFVRSGDIGKLDTDGFLTILDRKKDMIISGGMNVYPADIEAVLSAHPAVGDVTVVGQDHTRWGETPVAFVVLADALDGGEAGLMDWANTQLAKHQRVSRIYLRDQLPRNALGKVLKRELRDELAGQIIEDA